jgi:hypothetical protein
VGVLRPFYSSSAWAALVSAGALHAVVEDTAPQLGGALDANGHNVGFDDGTGITDDADNEQVLFHKTASAVNQVGLTNAATGNAPQLAAEGGDTNIDLKLRGKGSGQIDVDKLGINATADTTNRLALKSPASLFDNVGNGHQQKINKAAAGDTASQLFQTGYSGRAEYGLTGDDNFHIKVSPDGSAWKEALMVDRTTGFLGIGAANTGVSLLELYRASGGLLLANSDGGLSIKFFRHDNSASGTGVVCSKSRGTTASPTIVQSGDQVGVAQFNAWDGAAELNVARFRAEIDGVPGTGSMPGRFLVMTTPSGSGVAVERVRWDSAGNVGFGTTSPSNFASFEGIAAPQTDNSYTLGTAAKRWSEVYAATGTINTSDGRLKTDLQDSPLGLSFILGCRPRAFKWLDGGATVEWDEEEVLEEVPVTEAVTVPHMEIELRDGVAVERQTERIVQMPVVDLVPVVDEAGIAVLVDGKPRMHAVPRMTTRVDEVRRSKRETVRAGKRTHYGLIAQEVKEALSLAGVDDFAGWVLGDKDDPNSTQGLRYDQFLAPLIKAVQELAARVAALEARLGAS